jgi:aminomethyltransferase
VTAAATTPRVLQSHFVPGRGAYRFTVEPGAGAEIIDLEGLQRAVLFIAATEGAVDVTHAVESSELGGLAAPRGLAELDRLTGLDGASELSLPAFAAEYCDADARTTVAAACAEGFDTARVYRLFPDSAPPGRRTVVRAAAPVRCLLLAPGEKMAPQEQRPPTMLQLILSSPADQPPSPLAPAKLDIRVPAATATAYRVAAGDYIQIVDISGKQCSDFIAFDAAGLEQGQEWGIDATATRTLMGHTMPGPGLHSKYFDARMRPLVEMVRDTVGRHDAFLLACTAKYYADMGYPGHANCTDNFNRAIAPLGVAPRAGWPALNFFYNTFVQADGTIASDEPWSRPGDYVLLRALTDLICASSSCADDIDPANAWEPTDVQVRVYDASAAFSKGNANRMTADAAPELTRESGFHARTSALTRSFVDYKGFWTPTGYAANGPIDEYWACRERAAVIDLSALRKFEITGPDAEALLQLAVTRDVRRLAVGQVVYTALCHATGGMIDDGTLFRLGPQNFRLVCGDAYCGVWLRQLAAERGLAAWCRTSTDQLHNLAVQGPRSREILAAIVETPAHQQSLAALGWFRFTIGRIGEVPVVVSRTGYTGELGYEVWCHPDAGVAVWDAVWRAGQPHGLAPLGLAALDMLRIEAGLIFAGAEFSDETDPFEAGIGFAVPQGKADPYIGAEALARRRAQPQRQMVGLTIDSQETVGHGDPVFAGRTRVGVVTSATKSPVLRAHIALARVDVTSAALGQRLEIGKLDGRQKRLAATVTPFPHYDPQKSRVRA